MLDENKYVIQSLELHLFFARIMKEHSLFLHMGFLNKDSNFMRESNKYKLKFEDILSDSIELGDGIVSNSFLKSNEIITNFTVDVELITENLTGIAINKNVTKMETKLEGINSPKITPNLINYIKRLNRNAEMSVNGLIEFKQQVLKLFLEGKIFIQNSALLLQHIIREAELYKSYLIDIENGIDIETKSIKEKELFWSKQMMEHSIFIRQLLDGSEETLMGVCDQFTKSYKELIDTTKKSMDLSMDITKNSLSETIKFRDFKETATKGVMDNKIRSNIIVLLADHVLREANHFIRILEKSS